MRTSSHLELIKPRTAEQDNLADSIAEYLPYVTRVVYKLTRSSEIADDVVQQTMLRALLHAHQFRFESSLKTWLSSIAVNEIYQVYRSKWRKRAVPISAESLRLPQLKGIELPMPAYEARERGELLRRAVARLPKSYRRVVELCDLELLSLSEAANRLGLTVPAVKTRLHRARKRLRPFVEELKAAA